MMPGPLLLSMLVACAVVGGIEGPTARSNFAPFPPESSRGLFDSPVAAPRPSVDLDAEVLLYSGLPIELDGKIRYLGNLGTLASLNSMAVSEDGRVAVLAAYSDKPRFPYIQGDDFLGVALLREAPDGTLSAIDLLSAPVVGYPSGQLGSFPLLTSVSRARSAMLADGSYRTLVRLVFDRPDSALTGDWIVDINEHGIHPVLRQGWLDLSDGRKMLVSFDDSKQADFSLPIGGIGQILGTSDRVAWRLDGQKVVLLFNSSDSPLSNSSPPSGIGSYNIALTDGSVLSPSIGGKLFYARIGKDGPQVDFEMSPGQFPSLPDGSESFLLPSLTRRGHAIESGYFVALRGVAGGPFYEVTLANFGDGIRRFIDNETFVNFPPFDPPESQQTIFATNNRGDVVALRYTEAPAEATSVALYYSGQDEVWTPVAVSERAAQLGVFSGFDGLDFGIGSPIQRDITFDGTFLFGVNVFGLLSRGEIGWSPEEGYRLIIASGDFLTLPGDPTRPVQPFWRHAGQDPLSTTIFAIAQYDDDPEIGSKFAIVRQSLDSATPLADLNRDGDVDLLDLNIVVRGMSGGGTYQFSGDVDFDGQVDENDLQMLLDQWGER